MEFAWLALGIYLIGSLLAFLLLLYIHHKYPREGDWAIIYIGSIASWIVVGLTTMILIYDWHSKLAEKIS